MASTLFTFLVFFISMHVHHVLGETGSPLTQCNVAIAHIDHCPQTSQPQASHRPATVFTPPVRFAGAGLKVECGRQPSPAAKASRFSPPALLTKRERKGCQADARLFPFQGAHRSSSLSNIEGGQQKQKKSFDYAR